MADLSTRFSVYVVDINKTFLFIITRSTPMIFIFAFLVIAGLKDRAFYMSGIYIFRVMYNL